MFLMQVFNRLLAISLVITIAAVLLYLFPFLAVLTDFRLFTRGEKVEESRWKSQTEFMWIFCFEPYILVRWKQVTFKVLNGNHINLFFLVWQPPSAFFLTSPFPRSYPISHTAQWRSVFILLIFFACLFCFKLRLCSVDVNLFMFTLFMFVFI